MLEALHKRTISFICADIAQNAEIYLLGFDWARAGLTLHALGPCSFTEKGDFNKKATFLNVTRSSRFGPLFF
jgi:hypothetical protein